MVSLELPLDEIERTRAYLWRTCPTRQINNERGALGFIRELGFILLMPIAGAELPSMQQATAGDWWVWWDWKQTLPGRKACYYGHLLRNRGTFISWECFPCFYAAYSDGRPYQQLYREGLLDRSEKQVLDIINESGPMLTHDIRLAFGPRSKQNTRRVKALLVDLQKRFLIAAAGGDTEGWSHHRWDLVERWVRSGLLAEASRISRQMAREKLVAKCLRNLVATTEADIAWLFGWERPEVAAIVAKLVAGEQAQKRFVPEYEGDVLVPRPWPGKVRRRRKR